MHLREALPVTFLKRTGQLPSFSGGILVLFGGGMLLFGTLTDAAQPIEPIVAVFSVLTGIALVAAGFAWLCVRIKCPRCGARIFWNAVSRNPVNGWDQDLYGSACPSCEYAPE